MEYTIFTLDILFDSFFINRLKPSGNYIYYMP
jgi:hypothetical protein